MGIIWLINGIPGSGKTTTAAALARRLPRAAHVEGDRLQDMILAGGVWPGQQPEAESNRQLSLCVRNQCLLAQSFARENMDCVIDFVIVNPDRVAEYRSHLDGLELRLVTLAPGIETALQRDALRDKRVAGFWTHLDAAMRRDLADTGLWIDNAALSVEEVIDRILAAGTEARV